MVDSKLNLVVLKGLQAAVVKLGAAKGEKPAFDAEFVLQQAVSQSGIAAETFAKAAETFAAASHPVFVYGKGFVSEGDLDALKALVDLARMTRAVVINVKGKANSLAAAQYGLDKIFGLDGKQAAFIAVGDDQVSDRLVARLENFPFVVAQASYKSALTDKANVVLPVEIWCEQEGHYLNLEGRLQKVNKVIQSPEQVRSNVAVLKALAAGLGLAPDTSWKERLLRRVSAVTISEN